MKTEADLTEQSMSETDAERAEKYAAFRADLFDAGLLIDTGVDGLYAKSSVYESVVQALDKLITEVMVDKPVQAISFPPVMARWVFDKTDYLKSFPDLMGSVHTFRGTDRQHAELVSLAESGGDWPASLVPAEVVLCSATCHPIYALCSGSLPDGGRRFEVNGYCFRCEPSVDPTRMQAFRMHEYVYVGDADRAQVHRDGGLERGLDLLGKLGLEVEAIPANDPFFGRLGTMLAANQLDEALKMEIVTPVCSTERPTAIMSANCHRDHFGLPFGITDSSGEVAHSACVAFGVDRVTLALLRTHGLDPLAWPSAVRNMLWS
jgi:seryl-tRNA synthetase